MNLSEFLKETAHSGRAVFKHSLGKDCAIEIYSYNLNDDGDLVTDVIWLNVVNPNKVFPIERETVTIKKDQIQNWNRINVK